MALKIIQHDFMVWPDSKAIIPNSFSYQFFFFETVYSVKMRSYSMARKNMGGDKVWLCTLSWL